MWERKIQYLKSVMGLIYMSRLLRRWGYGSAIIGDNSTFVSLGLTDGSEFIGSIQGKYVPCCSGIVLTKSDLVLVWVCTQDGPRVVTSPTLSWALLLGRVGLLFSSPEQCPQLGGRGNSFGCRVLCDFPTYHTIFREEVITTQMIGHLLEETSIL